MQIGYISRCYQSLKITYSNCLYFVLFLLPLLVELLFFLIMIMAYLSIYRTPRDGDRPSTDKSVGAYRCINVITFVTLSTGFKSFKTK